MFLQEILEKVTLFDYVYIVLTILFIVQGTLKGFVHLINGLNLDLFFLYDI